MAREVKKLRREIKERLRGITGNGRMERRDAEMENGEGEREE